MSSSTSKQSIHANTEIHQTPVFQLKGGLYTLTSLQLLHNNLSSFAEDLDSKLQQAPKFFHNAPIVIDLTKIGLPGMDIDFKQLKQTLLSRNLIPVGIKGGTIDQHHKAIAQGFAVLPEASKEKSKPPETSLPSNETKRRSDSDFQPGPLSESLDFEGEPNEMIRGSNTRVITEPVRSGQQIYARGGDLLVLAPVSHGAELLADGHIHIYGPLRGRALAGVTGDTEARIFCQSLEAELISVAGQYKISEDFEGDAWQCAVDVHLQDGRLQIREL